MLVNVPRSRSAILVGIGLAVCATPAFAYLDPGTGSIILQGVIAAIAGAALTVKLYWRRIKSFFSSKKPAGESKRGSERPADQS